jgi:hypothetical protein
MLQRSVARERRVVFSALHMPLHAGQNSNEDPTQRLAVPPTRDMLGSFHSHPYLPSQGAASNAPSHRDLLNVTESTDFGPQHVHGVFGMEDATSRRARMHLMYVPSKGAHHLWDAGHTYAAHFAEARKRGILGEFFRHFGVGYAALTFAVEDGVARFDFGSALADGGIARGAGAGDAGASAGANVGAALVARNLFEV